MLLVCVCRDKGSILPYLYPTLGRCWEKEIIVCGAKVREMVLVSSASWGDVEERASVRARRECGGGDG
jgi:hypothetical protein